MAEVPEQHRVARPRRVRAPLGKVLELGSDARVSAPARAAAAAREAAARAGRDRVRRECAPALADVSALFGFNSVAARAVCHLDKTELKKEGIDTSVLGSAQLSLMPGSVCVGVCGVDDAMARLVCDWIVDEPRVPAVIERLLWQRAYEAYAPEAITWDGVKLVAHSCLPASTAQQMHERDGWFTAEVWLGEVPTDSSAMSIAGVVHRAVTSLVGVNASDVFALTTSRTLPFIKIHQLAPTGVCQDAR